MTTSGVRPFSFSAAELPRVPSGSVERTLVLARARAGWPRQVRAELRGLGTVVATPARLGLPSAGERFGIDVAGSIGAITLDPALALAIVGTLLGAPRGTLLRPLGRAERGVLGAVVATVLDALAPGELRLRLDGAPSVLDPTTVELNVSAAAAGLDGPAWLELPAAWLKAPRTPDPEALLVGVIVELGHTLLPVGELAAARPGDAVVFEGASCIHDDPQPWSVVLRLHDSVVDATLALDGTLRCQGPLRHQPLPLGSPMSSDARTREDHPPSSVSAAQVIAEKIAAAPVEVVAELGRLTVRGDELAGLLEGGVLALGSRRPTRVDLRVGDQLWAEGELVVVDDQLGVRLTRLV